MDSLISGVGCIIHSASADISLSSRGGGGGGYSHILAIWVSAAGKGVVFKPFGLVKGLVIIENWYSMGSRLTGSLTKD